MQNYNLTHLEQLESEAIFILRETAAQFERPGLLFSGGKDSIVMAHLAAKAFSPAKIPFPFVHVDTGHNFQETIAFRDSFVKKTGVQLIVGHVQSSIDKGTAVEETGPNASRNALQSVTLLETIEKESLDACLGGGRRDEEKARAKERFFSHRDAFGQWDPKNQRPELWNLFNGRKSQGENFRIFPLSNWTEMDVWQYAKIENIELPNLYFTHEREVVDRNGSLLAVSDFVTPRDNESPTVETVRFRTIGDATCTGAVLSKASNLDEVIAEVAASRVTERGARADDRR
jgi:sulfate adenylyltransferase subunit 2